MASRGPSGRTSPDQFVERLKELLAADAAERTQLKRRFSDFVREASQAVGPGRPGQRTDFEALLSRWLDFNLESYSLVSEKGFALLNGLLSAAERTLLPAGAPTPDTRTTPAPRVELRLSGRQGERATTGFVVENHFYRPLAVTFNSSDLVSKTGASLQASLVSFEPTTLMLDARAQGVVQVSVTITADFEIGETYTATIRLLGFEAKEVGLSVTALPSADAALPSKPLPQQPKSAKKRSRATK